MALQYHNKKPLKTMIGGLNSDQWHSVGFKLSKSFNLSRKHKAMRRSA